MSVDKLTQILSSDDLNAPQEEMVFEAAMLWLNKCSTRRQSLEKVSVSPEVNPYPRVRTPDNNNMPYKFPTIQR